MPPSMPRWPAGRTGTSTTASSRPDGSTVWVQEIGGGVFAGAELLYLEGVVIDADRSRLAELQNIADARRDLGEGAGAVGQHRPHRRGAAHPARCRG
jgi:hypothetical protein